MTTADYKRTLTDLIELDGVYKLLEKLAPTALAEIIRDLEADPTTTKIIDRAHELLIANVGEVETYEMLS